MMPVLSSFKRLLVTVYRSDPRFLYLIKAGIIKYANVYFPRLKSGTEMYEVGPEAADCLFRDLNSNMYQAKVTKHLNFSLRNLNKRFNAKPI